MKNAKKKNVFLLKYKKKVYHRRGEGEVQLIKWEYNSMVECMFCKHKVAGSNPAFSISFYYYLSDNFKF